MSAAAIGRVSQSLLLSQSSAAAIRRASKWKGAASYPREFHARDLHPLTGNGCTTQTGVSYTCEIRYTVTKPDGCGAEVGIAMLCICI